MIGRIAWALLLALLAGVTTFAQLDRASRYQPQLASFVPQPFSGFAVRHLAAQALIARDSQSAQALTQQLVKARPAPAEHMTMLAQAATLAEDQGAALAALSEASRRGWRDPVAQQSSAEAALLDGNAQVAAQRISALLATDALPQETSLQLARLLTTPEGREAFAQALAGPGRWQPNAPALAANVASPADLSKTLALAGAKGAQIPCIVLSRIADTYRNGGFEAEAEAFWPGKCPTS